MLRKKNPHLPRLSTNIIKRNSKGKYNFENELINLKKRSKYLKSKMFNDKFKELDVEIKTKVTKARKQEA